MSRCPIGLMARQEDTLMSPSREATPSKRSGRATRDTSLVAVGWAPATSMPGKPTHMREGWLGKKESEGTKGGMGRAPLRQEVSAHKGMAEDSGGVAQDKRQKMMAWLLQGDHESYGPTQEHE